MNFKTFFTLSLLNTLVFGQSLVDIISSQPDLKTLLVALKAVPRLTEQLSGMSGITILAPTDHAFDKVPKDSPLGKVIAQAAMATPEHPAPQEVRDNLRALLAYHVLKGSYPASAAMKTPVFVPTLLDSSFTVNGMAVADVTGGQKAGIVKGFRAGEVEIISGGLAISKVTQADIKAPMNVIIHKIDTLLQLPMNVIATGQEAGESAAVDALKKTGLDKTLDTARDLTVFIPNNQAFQNAQSVIAGADMKTLVKVLSYHAIVGNVLFSSQLMKYRKLKTVEGSEVTITAGQGGIMVDKAKVVAPDIILSNGVGHVIDMVLMPGN